MAIKALWYLSMADGHYPWMEDGIYPVDFDRYRRLAETIDQGGFMARWWPHGPTTRWCLPLRWWALPKRCVF